MSSRITNLLENASRDVLLAVKRSPGQKQDLLRYSEIAQSESDRKVLKCLIFECNGSEYEFARGLATGLLMRPKSTELRFVVSAPFDARARQTAGVIAELIGSAKVSIDFCSYILVHIDELLPMIQAAKQRGVKMRILLDADKNTDKSISTTLSSLEEELGKNSIRRWSTDGEPASMHAKFLIIDGQRALVTSANLTGRAITRNIEAGIMADDDVLINTIQNFFDELWESSGTSR